MTVINNNNSSGGKNPGNPGFLKEKTQHNEVKENKQVGLVNIRTRVRKGHVNFIPEERYFEDETGAGSLKHMTPPVVRNETKAAMAVPAFHNNKLLS